MAKASNPSPSDIAAARVTAGLTPRTAADLVYRSERWWHATEAGKRPFELGLWELFQWKSAGIIPPLPFLGRGKS
jgi:hypothetical protein